MNEENVFKVQGKIRIVLFLIILFTLLVCKYLHLEKDSNQMLSSASMIGITSGVYTATEMPPVTTGVAQLEYDGSYDLKLYNICLGAGSLKASDIIQVSLLEGDTSKPISQSNWSYDKKQNCLIINRLFLSTITSKSYRLEVKFNDKEYTKAEIANITRKGR